LAAIFTAWNALRLQHIGRKDVTDENFKKLKNRFEVSVDKWKVDHVISHDIIAEYECDWTCTIDTSCPDLDIEHSTALGRPPLAMQQPPMTPIANGALANGDPDEVPSRSPGVFAALSDVIHGRPPDGGRACHCPEEPLANDALFIDQPYDHDKAEAKTSPCIVTTVLPDLRTKELTVAGTAPIDQPYGCALGGLTIGNGSLAVLGGLGWPPEQDGHGTLKQLPPIMQPGLGVPATADPAEVPSRNPSAHAAPTWQGRQAITPAIALAPEVGNCALHCLAGLGRPPERTSLGAGV
jgi:hypothetical protein